MGIEIPKKQGNTIFSSGINAYEKLPENIKQKIKNATGIFSSEGPIAATRIEREKEMGIKSAKKMEAEHPIVQEVNGRKSLYISPGHLIKIKNIDDDLDFKDSLIKKLSIALDIKDNQIVSHGWQKTNNLSLEHIVNKYNDRPIHSYFVTDVANDGMLSGLNIRTFSSIKQLTNKHITIGGGVKDLNDLELSKINGFNNVVVGKAIYENKITIESLAQFNA